MPRKRLDPAEDEWLIQGWKTFGRWLRERRIAKRFSLQQAADAVKVSKRQWIRYEQGAKVPDRRLDRIARKLNIERRRIYLMAGHQLPRKKNDAPQVLQRMHVSMRTGDLTAALEQFLQLYENLRPEEDASDREIDNTLAPNFAHAVIFLDALPTWLFKIVLECMQGRLEKQRKDSGTYVRFRNSLLKDCLAKLKLDSPSIIDAYPDVRVCGGYALDQTQYK